ncbi:MAG: hypothetical protein AAGF24_14175 [Cyanobacteria bacterium P01_H01_bin.121]
MHLALNALPFLYHLQLLPELQLNFELAINIIPIAISIATEISRNLNA